MNKVTRHKKPVSVTESRLAKLRSNLWFVFLRLPHRAIVYIDSHSVEKALINMNTFRCATRSFCDVTTFVDDVSTWGLLVSEHVCPLRDKRIRNLSDTALRPKRAVRLIPQCIVGTTLYRQLTWPVPPIGPGQRSNSDCPRRRTRSRRTSRVPGRKDRLAPRHVTPSVTCFRLPFRCRNSAVPSSRRLPSGRVCTSSSGSGTKPSPATHKRTHVCKRIR